MLADILAKPHDLALRKVFADRAIERGDPRGEFVQLQCALEELAADDPRREALDRRAREILRDRRREWLRDLPGDPRIRVTFRRGFPETVTAPASLFLAEAEAIRRSAPVVGVRLEDATAADLDALLGAPILAQLRSIEVATDAFEDGNDAALARFFRSSKLPPLEEVVLHAAVGPATAAAIADNDALRLRVLSLSPRSNFASSIGGEGAKAIAGSRALHALEALTMSGQELGVKAWQALAGASWPKLVSLSLDGCAVGARGAVAIANSPFFQGLRAISMRAGGIAASGLAALASGKDLSAIDVADRNKIDAAAVRAFLDALPGSNLRALHLGGANLGRDGVEALASSTKLSKLALLDLTSAKLGDGIDVLAATDRLPSLATLVLANVGLRAPDCTKLADGAILRSVRALDLSHNKIQTAGLKALAGCKHLALETLSLDHNWIGSQGVEALVKNAGLAESLRRLLLGEGNYGAPGLVAIARSRLRALEELEVRGVDRVSVTALAESDVAKSLRRLSISGSPTVGDAGLDALVASPQCAAIEHLHLSFVGQTAEGAGRVLARFGDVRFWPPLQS